jgi:hypothetical protein
VTSARAIKARASDRTAKSKTYLKQFIFHGNLPSPENFTVSMNIRQKKCKINSDKLKMFNEETENNNKNVMENTLFKY